MRRRRENFEDLSLCLEQFPFRNEPQLVQNRKIFGRRRRPEARTQISRKSQISQDLSSKRWGGILERGGGILDLTRLMALSCRFVYSIILRENDTTGTVN